MPDYYSKAETDGLLDLKQDLSEKDTLNGYPSIDNVPYVTTISALRSSTGDLLSGQFYVTDLPGLWRYDSLDSTTADDGYTTLVTADDKRIKRVGGDCCEVIHEYEELYYSSVMNISFNRYIPNKRVVLEGNVFVAINNTIDSDSGSLQLIRSTDGDEIINLNGYLLKDYGYPQGAGAIIVFNYININGRLYWTCINPVN